MAEKNPDAVSLGRRGGLKGGVARALKLAKERRVEIAKRAAAARWAKRDERPPHNWISAPIGRHGGIICARCGMAYVGGDLRCEGRT
jgi:hypothetical protein